MNNNLNQNMNSLIATGGDLVKFTRYLIKKLNEANRENKRLLELLQKQNIKKPFTGYNRDNW